MLRKITELFQGKKHEGENQIKRALVCNEEPIENAFETVICTNSIFTIFNKFLTLKDQKALRIASKKLLETIRSTQPIPFTTKASFTFGFSCIYTRDHIAHQNWPVYNDIISSQDRGCAILYKLSEGYKNKVGYLKGSSTTPGGYTFSARVYPPGFNHTWPRNFVWVIACIQARKEFLLASDLSLKNMMRNTDGRVVSAFASEIAIALKAGYRLEIRSSDLFLVPGKHSHLCEPSSLLVTREETKVAYKNLMQQRDTLFSTYTTIKEQVECMVESIVAVMDVLTEMANPQSFLECKAEFKLYLNLLKAMLLDSGEVSVKIFLQVFPNDFGHFDKLLLEQLLEAHDTHEAKVDCIMDYFEKEAECFMLEEMKKINLVG